MAKLIYSAITSLDGFVEDTSGNFGWAAPDEEVHCFINELERKVGTYLYGRRMYEVMVAWETLQSPAGEQACVGEYADIWRSAEKIVYSRTLARVPSARTRLERHFDTAAVSQMKEAAERDLGVGGPDLAGQAIKAGLVDEFHLFAAPVLVGLGKHWLPAGLHLELELLSARRFGGGMLHAHYRFKRGHAAAGPARRRWS
jgi:dihydrofolate reductase